MTGKCFEQQRKTAARGSDMARAAKASHEDTRQKKSRTVPVPSEDEAYFHPINTCAQIKANFGTSYEFHCDVAGKIPSCHGNC